MKDIMVKYKEHSLRVTYEYTKDEVPEILILYLADKENNLHFIGTSEGAMFEFLFDIAPKFVDEIMEQIEQYEEGLRDEARNTFAMGK